MCINLPLNCHDIVINLPCRLCSLFWNQIVINMSLIWHWVVINILLMGHLYVINLSCWLMFIIRSLYCYLFVIMRSLICHAWLCSLRCHCWLCHKFVMKLSLCCYFQCFISLICLSLHGHYLVMFINLPLLLCLLYCPHMDINLSCLMMFIGLSIYCH